MLIIEANISQTDYDPAYFLYQTNGDGATFKRGLAALALEYCGDSEEDMESVYGFTRQLDSQSNVLVRNEHKELFHSVASNFNGLRNDRLRRLTKAAKLGHLSTNALMDEYNLLAHSTDINSLDGSDATYLTKDGLTAYMTKQGLWVDGEDIAELEDDSHVFEVAKELGLKSWALQSEVRWSSDRHQVPHVTGNDYHTALGSIEDGEFEPVVTVLSSFR